MSIFYLKGLLVNFFINGVILALELFFCLGNSADPDKIPPDADFIIIYTV